MTLEQIMFALQKAGTAKNRKIYARHGVGEDMIGVSFTNLKALAERIKTDHALAQQLWKTGTHDARVLATMLADSNAVTSGLLDRWAKNLDNHVIADLFSAFVGRTQHAKAKAEKWLKSKNEWIGAVAWNLVAGIAMNSTDLPDRYFEGKLKTIETHIHSAKNRVRYSMNQALIGIGIRNKKLGTVATATAHRIGKVVVDHGKTGCKTPDAVEYIEKTLAYRKKRRSGRR